MSGCPGLHCAGCGSHGGGRAVAVVAVALAVLLAAEWVAARVWWVIGGTVLIAAVTLAAVRFLMRWTVRREAAFAAHRAALRAGQLREIGHGVPVSGAIEGGLHIHLHGLAADEQAEVIRKAIDPRLSISLLTTRYTGARLSIWM